MDIDALLDLRAREALEVPPHYQRRLVSTTVHAVDEDRINEVIAELDEGCDMVHGTHLGAIFFEHMNPIELPGDWTVFLYEDVTTGDVIGGLLAADKLLFSPNDETDDDDDDSQERAAGGAPDDGGSEAGC